ncbi:hypothetical protein [Leptospira sp. mild_001]|nr:hypothetical protein [Leptospira sp. mild_001]
MNRVGKLSTTLSYGSRWKTQHNAFLWVVEYIQFDGHDAVW